MRSLKLRQVSPSVAAASRLLGRGRWLEFSNAGDNGRLTLSPMLSIDSAATVALGSARGLLRLSNANALLSLFGSAPVVCAGPLQPWYWQYVNQQLSPTLAGLFAPLEPLEGVDEPLPDRLDCRITVQLAGETAHGVLSIAADTLLRIFDAAPWQAIEQALPADWPLHYPVVLGRLTLTINQLGSLRVGDVVLPAEPCFDSDGNGQLQLGARHWTVAALALDDNLQMRLIREKDLHDGQ
ncbi:type III secretion system protein [Pseudomonas sp. 10S4]|uniref:type III secretion system protein n=1 Tax=Pseudomonas sp. 10S4 TaxID=3048583 RepID=UPI002AC98200|nr:MULTISPECIES: type III secretion system protein [unclassified Pseudomonas]MEB0223831.1 type III secretion system protein [Pseudomonas sp. 5S1]MEB0292791.1 type III secretion system protein [Pseudomonas sp. 10S4]WPX16296.1 type III secretion system protein [Pseudomonas sp. 10S4]